MKAPRLGVRLEAVSLPAEAGPGPREKKRIRRHIKELPERSVVLFEDETDVMLFPPLQSGWAKQGEPADVMLCGGNAKRVVFGTLSLTGHRLFLVRRKQRAADFQKLLKLVHDHYRGWSVLMLLDGDSSHTAASSVDLAETLDIGLEWLPVRSPELNAIEDLWGDGKDVICANHQYPNITEQTDAFLNYLNSHTNHQAKPKTGLLHEA